MNQSLTYAHFHQRALAWILDLLLLMAVLSPFVYLFNQYAPTYLYSEYSLILFRLVRLVLVLVIGITALSWSTARFGGTPGKILLDLQVINSTTHAWLTPHQAQLRLLLSIPVICSVLGILLMFFNPQRQAFHDKVLHTLVIVKASDDADEPLPGDL